MENKKGNLSAVFLVIATILIVVMGVFMYMQKTEADRQIAELENNATKLQETINDLQGKTHNITNTINSNDETTNNTDKTEELNEIKESLTPSGFSGSSLIRVVLCNDKTVYVVNYDGVGYEENNVISKILIAKNVERIEYNGEGEKFKSIMIKGDGIEIIDNSYNWIEFEAKFYELKEISKEYRDYENVKNYKDFIYDLDGDGTNDKITLSHTTEKIENGVGGELEKDIYSAKLNGEIFSEGTSMDSIYIVDLNENDKNIEVVIFDDGPSDDPNYTIYSKDGNKMVKLENIFGFGFKIDKKGTVLVPDVYTYSISPEIYFDYYFVNNNQIERKFVDVDKVKGIDFQSQTLNDYFALYFSEDFNNLDKFKENAGCDVERLKEFNIEKLNKDITFNILNFEIVEDYKIYVELSDGRKGYIFHMQLAG